MSDPRDRTHYDETGQTRITCLTCGRALTPGGPVCCPKPIEGAAAIVGGCCAHCDSLGGERPALLDEAGPLATPQRDAAVAAKAWEKGFERGFYTGTSGMFGPDSDASEADVTNPYEREAGESDADA